MFARTERLLLRPAWREDAPALAAAIGDEAIVRNLSQVPWPYGEAEAQAFAARERDPAQPDFLIFARTMGAPRLVGGCGITRRDDGDLELGYWIARRYWGLGFATEAGKALVGIARAMDLPRLKAGHFLDNPASGHVLRKIGFLPTGRIVPRHSRGRGESVPCALFEEAGLCDLPQADMNPRARETAMAA